MGRINLKNRRKSKMKIIIFSSLLFVFVCFSVGYAAFSSNVRIDVRGTTKGSTLLTSKILNL